MEYKYKKLDLDKNATVEEIKKSYLKKVKEFPPERNPDKFIEIRKAYEDILEYVNNEKYEVDLIKRHFKMIKFTINNNDERQFFEHCNSIKELINIQNFKIISDETVDLILYSKRNSRKKYSLMLTEVFIEEFNMLGLKRLAERYLYLSSLLREEINW